MYIPDFDLAQTLRLLTVSAIPLLRKRYAGPYPGGDNRRQSHCGNRRYCLFYAFLHSFFVSPFFVFPACEARFARCGYMHVSFPNHPPCAW